MRNCDIANKTRPLEAEEKIKEGDLFQTEQDQTIQWLDVSKSYWGTPYDPKIFVSMRRPIAKEKKKKGVIHGKS